MKSRNYLQLTIKSFVKKILHSITLSLHHFITSFIIILLTSSNVFSSGIRQPAVAGQFYPSNKEELSSMINIFLNAVHESAVTPSPHLKVNTAGKIIGVVAPHAGYVFSGGVAAYSFKPLEGKTYDIVILLGQSHHFFLDKAALSDDDEFSTPLGNVRIDTKIINALASQSTGLFEINKGAHRPEHCLEVEIPFLQSVLTGKFSIVPILVGNFDLSKCEKISGKIFEVIKKFAAGKKILLVISTDMSHYPKYEDANIYDNIAIKSLEKFDPLRLKQTNDSILSRGIPSLDCVFCGEEAVITGMYLAKHLGANKVKSLKYANSGDVPVYGTKDRVVGYYAGAFLQEKKMKNEFSITLKNQKLLLELARSTIDEFFKTRKIKEFKTQDTELLTPAAVFVTLTIGGQLRGCIGTTSPQAPLYQAVQQMALAAAFEDYRFNQLTPQELQKVKIEISVLSPLTKVKSADEIKEKIHGVTVRRGTRGGLFLPQVWEHFSRKEDFLGELCSQKAGLPEDAWCDPDTELCVFTVFAFEEE
ncbi:MAG: AmmeMemoRadiSam system protein B [Elusimicrobiota bacterium]